MVSSGERRYYMVCLCVDLTGDEVLYGLLVCGFVEW